jgi:hypothetical protein
MSSGLTPFLVALVGVVASAVIAYPLGRAQGRQQTLHEEQVKIMVELRRRLGEVDALLWVAAMRADDEEFRMAFFKKLGELGDYHHEKCIWLKQRLNTRIEEMIEAYEKQGEKIAFPSRTGEILEVSERKTADSIHEWTDSQGKALVSELEDEARRLLGVDRAARWRRFFLGS